MDRTTRLLPVLLVGGALAFGQEARAAGNTYYVATNGVDTPGGGGISNPWRTINYGKTRMAGGDTLYIRSGTYAEVVDFDATKSGSASQPTTIAAYAPGGNRESVTLAGLSFSNMSYVVVDGLIVDGKLPGDGGGIWFGNFPEDNDHLSSYMTIQNCEVKNTRYSAMGGGTNHSKFLYNKVHHNGTDTNLDHGMYLQGNYNAYVGNEIYSNATWGLHLYDSNSSSYTESHNLIAFNKFHDGGGLIISDAGSTDNLIHGNLFWNNAAMVVGWATNSKIYNNTIADSKNIQIQGGANSANTDIQNNIAGGIVAYDGNWNPQPYAGYQNYNLWTNATNPQFVNPAAFDFHLQPSSPAIDAGIDLSAAGVTTDFDGIRRPQGAAFDIGAYEYHTGITPLPGDLNGDGKRDLADVRLLIYMLLGQEPTTPEADLTGDGAVTLADVQALIRLLVGIS